MAYERPKNPLPPLSKQEKLNLLADYIQHYRQMIAEDKTVLNRKVPREDFADLLDRIGEMLLTESAKLATREGPIRTFLKNNPLPRSMGKSLPDHFRVFCLALNSLKQWVAAEQAATDRYLLGGGARALCRTAVKTCLVTDIALGQDNELHHPVRDGRPPILLSKKGHDSIEDQLATVHDDPVGKALGAVRRERHGSWAQLRRGCLDLLGKREPWPSKASAAGARAFAKKAMAHAGAGYGEILDWLDRNGC